MTIKCPICGAEYSEGTVRFCKICMYSIGTDVFLTNLLNHPSEEDLMQYNQDIAECRSLWNERNSKSSTSQNSAPTHSLHSGMVEMIEVEGGTFKMGNNDLRSNEKPAHEVTVGSFMIGKYVIIQEVWESVMGDNPSNFKGLKRPVEKVSWYDAIEFCNMLSKKEGLEEAYSGNGDKVTCYFGSNGYRLPTEAEWEYAARGGGKSERYYHSGSNDFETVGWTYGNSKNMTHEVGLKMPNGLGIYDMSGNVWEWCWDRFGAYSAVSQVNPLGPVSGSNRVIRGCGWNKLFCDFSIVHRDYFSPHYKFDYLGFRLVRTKI